MPNSIIILIGGVVIFIIVNFCASILKTNGIYRLVLNFAIIGYTVLVAVAALIVNLFYASSDIGTTLISIVTTAIMLIYIIYLFVYVKDKFFR